MGSSLDRPADSPGTLPCPLCHRDSHNYVQIECGHVFCKSCITELWSGLARGPYFCPECNHQVLQLPEFARAHGAPAGPYTGWPPGRSFPSERTFLGKRRFSSGGGQRLGTASSQPNVSGDGTAAKRKPPPSAAGSNPTPQPAAFTNPDGPSTSGMDTETGAGPDNQKSSPMKQTAPPSPPAPPPCSNGASPSDLVPCHYCTTHSQRPAVKTCLVCGASMCPEHLRTHLESPVFQSHPLVNAVSDVSPYRCQEHQEMNRIYCRDCGYCVCTVCTVIGSHKEHVCISIKEAEKELRGTLRGKMKKIQTMEAAVTNHAQKINEEKSSVQTSLQEVRAVVGQRYKAMREALEVEEQQALLCVEQEQQRVVGSMDAQLEQLSTAHTSIQNIFHPLSQLADAQGTSRAQDQAFIMEYKRISESWTELSDPMEQVGSVEQVNQGRLDCLQEWMETRMDMVVISMPHRDPFRLLYGLTPTLDPDTAHPKLWLSDGNRRVEFSESQQSYPDNEARFSVFPQVLGAGPLTQGRHYWEVEVSVDEGRWKVGVSDGQIGRKGQKDTSRLGFYPNSWCLVCEKGKVEALHNKETVAVLASGLQRVGVLLDFEQGSLSFYSVAEEGALTLLYSFQHAFTEPLYPALALSKTQLCILDLFARPSDD